MYIEQAINFAYENQSKFKRGLDDCLLCYLQNLIVPDFIKQKRQSLIKKYLVQSKFYSPSVPDFVFMLEPNKKVQLHNDIGEEIKFNHKRILWVVQPAENGGNFCYEDEQIKFTQDGDYFVDVTKNHGLTKNLGKSNLILYSFGFIG